MNNLLIGYGYWGKKIYQSLLRYSKPYIFDKNSKDNSLLSRTLEDFLADEQIENCFIITPEESHFKIAKKCLLANKNVFVEKPLALREKEVEELIELSQKKNKLLFVDEIFLYDSFYLRLKQLINSRKYKNKLGEIIGISSVRHSVGFSRDNVSVTDDLMIHDLYLFEDLLGEKLSIKNFDKDREDSARKVEIQFLTASKIEIKAKYSYLEKDSQRKIIINFKNGHIIWDKFSPHLTIKTSSKTEKNFPKEQSLSAIDKMLDNFLELSKENEDHPEIQRHQRYIGMLEYLRNESSSF